MYMEKLFKCIIYKYLIFHIANDMIKAVKNVKDQFRNCLSFC